jgi:hypothetical protein
MVPSLVQEPGMSMTLFFPLLKHGNEVLVLTIDQATTRQLKRIGVGEPVTFKTTGSIRTSKGMSQ